MMMSVNPVVRPPVFDQIEVFHGEGVVQGASLKAGRIMLEGGDVLRDDKSCAGVARCLPDERLAECFRSACQSFLLYRNHNTRGFPGSTMLCRSDRKRS